MSRCKVKLDAKRTGDIILPGTNRLALPESASGGKPAHDEYGECHIEAPDEHVADDPPQVPRPHSQRVLSRGVFHYADRISSVKDG